MKRCPHCQRRFPEGLNYCPKDGQPLRPAPERDDPLIGQTLIHQFEVCERLGAGSMGTVYKAWQESMERHVAVKIMRPEMVGEPKVIRRFQREARAAARLSHPNIITVHLVGETDDERPFIVMEHVEGESLEAVIEREGRLAPIRALHLARQIAAALSEAHANDVIHRDLKPANIHLVRRRKQVDQVKVLDFGIAKILQESEESQITQTGAIFGTPYYLSPEQASGAEVDHRCDIYSLGVLLFQLLTGKLPFDAINGMEVLIKHLKEPPPRLRDLVGGVPGKLEALVLEMLAKAPEERPQSADAVIHAIEEILAALYPGAPRSYDDATAVSDPPQSTRPASQPFITLSAAESPWDEIELTDTAPAGKETLREAALLPRRRYGRHALFTLLALTLGAGLGFGAHALRRGPARKDGAAPAAPPRARDAHARAPSPDSAPPPPDARVSDTAKAPPRAKTSREGAAERKRRLTPSKRRRRPKRRRSRGRKRGRKMEAEPKPKPPDAGPAAPTPDPAPAPIAPLPLPPASDDGDDHGSATPAPTAPKSSPYDLVD